LNLLERLFSFTTQSRLLHAKAFEAVFNNPVYKPRTTFFRILAKPNDLTQARLGITVAKRRLKSAVKRNKIRRLVRESFRLTQHKLKNVDIVVIYTGPRLWTSVEITRCLTQQWKVLSF